MKCINNIDKVFMIWESIRRRAVGHKTICLVFFLLELTFRVCLVFLLVFVNEHTRTHTRTRADNTTFMSKFINFISQS